LLNKTFVADFGSFLIPDNYISQGSVATHLRYGEIFNAAESDGERILKIG